jgi:hypothetical protein
MGGLVLAVVLPFVVSGCSTLGLHKSPPKDDMPSNTWIKPAKPEPQPGFFSSLFFKEKKQPDSPSKWLEQKRLE